MPALKRALILEDDLLSAKLLQSRVAREWPECAFVHAGSRTDYVNALSKNNFDVILSDHSIPNFSGTEALSIAREVCPEVPFMFVSGSISEEVAVESMKAGAVDYILKDRPARLVPAINRALDLAEANSRRVEYDVLVNTVDGIVWQADQASLRFIFVSQQAERILGYPVASWTSEPDFWQDHLHPEDREMAADRCRRLTTEQNRLDFEYRMVAADGRVVWLRGMLSVRVKRNCAPQIQGIMVDVTRNKLAGQKIREVQQQLEESNKDLVRRNQEIQNFYHVLSHELKTPLTAAREFISMVIDGLAGPLNKTQAEYLGIAKESCNQLRLCINDLLDTTRIETGKLSLEFKRVNLVEILDCVVKTMSSKADELNIELRVESSSGLPDIDADQNRIRQVVTNLIDNAFKFTPSGGRITVELGEVFGRPDYLQVAVRDTGRGIPQKEQDSIFDRLYQIKSGDASNGNGIGLGLYLCRELVWLHGGVISVKSEVGKGSVFTVLLPKSQKRVLTDVLVIDDNPKVLETISTMLGSEYTVRTVKDGLDGLREMQQREPDVVIMDLNMPQMDGAELLKELRDKWASVPVIVHTAYSDGDIMKRAMKYSPFTLLSKPSDMDAIRRAVRHVCLGPQKESDSETRIAETCFYPKPKPPAPEDAWAIDCEPSSAS